MTFNNNSESAGLYHPSFEHDACGIGFVASIAGAKSINIVSDALTILENMEHRGASGSEVNSGDGAGIQIQIPHELFFEECLAKGISLPAFGRYAVGVLFFSKDVRIREACRDILNRAVIKVGLEILTYRNIPVNNATIGNTALSVEPEMEHVFITCPDHIKDQAAFERKLYVLRNYTTHAINNSMQLDAVGFYIASLSSKSIVYKGQLTSKQVRNYFNDLTNEKCMSGYALVHSRFATNTFPSWKLAQPFRYIAHNGEINTLQGNLNWLKAAQHSFESNLFTSAEIEMLLPIIGANQSDSACLDNVIELLTLTGRSLPHVMMMLIPEAWDGNEQMPANRKSFYEYHASLMEPWDGPASISFTDGKIIGATLDRNGLRPSRYCITNDGRVIMASETGALPIDPSIIIKKGRLQPGKMFVVDMEKGTIISDDELKDFVSNQQPYSDWLTKYKIKLADLPEPRVMFTHLSEANILKYQKAFGYSSEDVMQIIKVMAINAKEPIGSMGCDTPLAALSYLPQHLSAYFKQLFAQVTNPPIDPIRERMVMSLATFVGNNGNLLSESPEHCHTVALNHPVLTSGELEKLRSIDTGIFQAKTLQSYFKADGKAGSLKNGLDRICRYAEDAVNDGFEVIILSDRAIDSEHAPIPSLLVTAAVHHHLIRKGLRSQVGLVVEAGDVWEVHHFATLIGFGATAINPYLALATIRTLKSTEKIKSTNTWHQLRDYYIKAVCDGLLKVFSKMGISTLQSYQGAQIFEILGLSSDVVSQYFTGATSRIGGLSLDDIAFESLVKHSAAFKQNGYTNLLPVGGLYQWKQNGAFHLFNPTTIHLLQQATRTNDYNLYKKYAKHINDMSENASTIRSFFEFTKHRQPINIDEVEPAENIYKRFATGAMSFGSISWEAHTTLAIAMNRLGGKSNTGEGGEDETRYQKLPNGDSMRSAIKQVASARFGVNSLYLTEADEIQIKMAQGAKPGEGGQLPGHKVDKWIAKTRYSTPGVGLISPPPHHDIYSIEDLAQLIFDLKNANRQARINVKLVSKAGVGTIAAGVVKAKADVVLIAGHDGGTGASPISSTKHAGLPWEMGLAEAHQTLVRNRLRNRVVLQTDGQLKTGRDIAIATLLGAEEWGIATAALIVQGCIMMRKCHENTCPVGVATQDPLLRKRFTGDANHIVQFFKFITQELREIMAELGYKTINEMVGQVGSLKQKKDLDFWKHQTLDFSKILYKEPLTDTTVVYNNTVQNHDLNKVLDFKLIEVAQPALQNKVTVKANFNVLNTDRAVLTMLSNEITKKYGSSGLQDDTILLNFKGTAGQSFGAFATKGITAYLMGDANDYFGKGLCGAKLVIFPDERSTYIAEENSIIGNVALYGATSGKAYIRGKAGERFAVRNSGATVVVEGVGDHACEYMTGGLVIILGQAGKNFGAGMSGGLAYVYDVDHIFEKNCNMEMIDIESLNQDDINDLETELRLHTQFTKSTLSRFILNDFDQQIKQFKKVYPKEYKKALAQQQSIKMQTV